MGAIDILLASHYVVLCLFQMVGLSSEQFTVTGLQKTVLVPLGGNLELSCQLHPPQQAQHMEIRWFRTRYTEPVHLYKNGEDRRGEIISKYGERTDLLKDAIGKGKVTLRISKVTADDDGSYHCFFKDGKFYEEHITEVKVTAMSSEIQILMHPPNTKGVMLECHSGGWFPQPHMEWRDSKGEIIPATSKSHSQDENKLFNMTIALLIEANSYRNVTCNIQNPLTHQEESISIVLSGELFSWKTIWIAILSTIAFVLIAFYMTYCVQQNFTHRNFWEKWFHTLFTGLREVDPSKGSCLRRNCSWRKSAMALIISVLTITGAMFILHQKQRVPVSDQHFELDTLWLEDISVILCILIVFNIKLISIIYFRLEGLVIAGKTCAQKLNIIIIVSLFLCFIVSSATILLAYLQLQNKVSTSDPLHSLYNSWMVTMAMVIGFLVAVFTVTTFAKSWSRLKNWLKNKWSTPTSDEKSRNNKVHINIDMNWKTQQKKGNEEEQKEQCKESTKRKTSSLRKSTR